MCADVSCLIFFGEGRRADAVLEGSENFEIDSASARAREKMSLFESEFGSLVGTDHEYRGHETY